MPRSAAVASFVVRRLRWCDARSISWICAAPAWPATMTLAPVPIFRAAIKPAVDRRERWQLKAGVFRTRGGFACQSDLSSSRDYVTQVQSGMVPLWYFDAL